MGLLDKVFDKDDNEKAGKGAAKPASEAPRADFSKVKGSSSTTSNADSAEAARTYTVKAGDSLSAIAKRELGDASKWQALFEANRDKISNPDLIHPGQVLTIPNV